MTRLARRITQGRPKEWGMYARALGVPGDLIHLELGRPVEDTPAHIKAAAKAALDAGHVHYSDLQGIPELRQAIARRLGDHGLDYGADEIVVTNGLTQACYAAFMAFLDPGDEVILLSPHYPQHVGKAELAGADPVFAPLDAANGFALDAGLIAPYVTERTKAVALVNPCNPTGRVYSRAELEGLAAICDAHDLMVFSDEVYDRILYDGARHVSIASLPGMRGRTVTMGAMTKAYAMDGWRIGWAALDRAYVPGLMKITSSEVTHVNTPLQYGAVAALEGPEAVLAGLVADDKARRDLVVSRLNQMPGVTCALPEGTIYAWPDIRGTGLGSAEAAERLLLEAGVVVESGAFYGAPGEGHLRVCFGAERLDRLDEAMNRMQAFFNGL